VNSTRIEAQLDLPREAQTHAEVCALVVTYNPDSSLEQNVRALLPQVGKLIIVDNQSSPAARSLVARVASACEVEIVWNDRNLGIAAGLNAGIDRALACGQYSWIATFDQDSLVPPDFVAAVFEAYSSCPFRDQVAMIGANYKLAMRESTDEPTSVRDGSIFREVKTLMTSGSFLKSSVFGRCGRFDQSLFMDYVDHEFCLRLRQHGFRIIQATRAVLDHQLGSPTLHRFLWKRFLVTNYSASRRYYNARNRLIVYRRYLTSDPLWVLHDIFKWLRETTKLILVEQNRRVKLVSLISGSRDGMREPLRAQPDPTGVRKKADAAGEPGERGREVGG
jgi:rhamnosyltransferase